MPATGAPGYRMTDQFASDHPEGDPSATEVVVGLQVTAGLLLAQLDRVLRTHGLSTGSFNVLQVLAAHDERLTPSQISEMMPVPVTTATMTGVLDTLERRNLVARHPHPTDRRRVLIELTADGSKLLEEVIPGVLEREKAWTEPLSPSSRRQITAGMTALQEHLRGLAR
jgi:DNA-binding MarR family transcriptional regulator